MKSWITLSLLMLFFAGFTGEPAAAERKYSFDVATGFGYDSNAFLSPGRSYFDPILEEVVVPEKRSGFFVPVSVTGDARYGSGPVRFLPSLDFEGKFYSRKDLNNADTYQAKLNGGIEILLGKKDGARNVLLFGPFVGYHREIFFDRDTGDERVTRLTGRQLGDRFTYSRYGVESRLRLRTLPIRLDLRGEVSKYDYEEVPILDSLDYVYTFFSADVEFDVMRDTTLKVGGDYYIHDFEDRRSRDLRGDLVDDTKRKYTYYGVGATLGRKFAEHWTAFFDYDHLRRSDEFAGYNDYDKDRFRVRTRYRDGKDRRLSIEMAYWRRDYPKAFAFDDPGFPRKSYSTWEGGVRGETPLRKAWKLWADYEFINQNSSDPRYDYRRHQVSLGVGAEL